MDRPYPPAVNLGQHDQNKITRQMAAHETALFAQFSRLCAERGLLQGCDDVKEGDRPDGVADETTLR